MVVYNRRQLETALLKSGLLSREELARIVTESNNSGKRVARLLLEQKLVEEEQLLSVMERELGFERINLSHYPVDPEVTGRVPAELACRYTVMPIAAENGRITLAMADPLDLEAIDNVSMTTGAEIVPVLARESNIKHLLARFYGFKGNSAIDILPAREAGRSSGNHAAADLKDNRQTPVVKLVDSLIEEAIEEGASDIHLEQGEKELRIRMRLDGVLHNLAVPPELMQPAVISRVKIMANLDIAEKRLPQDGNINWQEGRAGIYLRVSTLPTVNGEKVVIRLLEKERIVLPLEKLGFSSDNYYLLLRLLLNQHGLLLVTGPTGCGKTTTLYSALHHLNRPQVNIVTVEDPVEYRLQGISQVQVNRKINRTFANSLRSILRQDPDIIMVGEIRDLETAKITTQAALTGHLVLSTLHTNNAAGAVTRLIDMGLEDYLVTASLIGVIAQRLVRRTCNNCAVKQRLTGQEKIFFGRYFETEPPEELIRGAGCSLCNQTGYRGRLSIQEVLHLNRELQDLIMKGASAEVIQQIAVEGGMLTMVQDGLRLILAGQTTIGEIARSTFNTLGEPESALNEETIAYLSGLQRSGE
jgi:type IV pilus assembly protein PilB